MRRRNQPLVTAAAVALSLALTPLASVAKAPGHAKPASGTEQADEKNPGMPGGSAGAAIGVGLGIVVGFFVFLLILSTAEMD